MAAFRDVGGKNSEDFKIGFDLGEDDRAGVCVCCAAADLTDVVVSVALDS